MTDKYTPQELDTIIKLVGIENVKEIINIVKQSLIKNTLLVISLEDEASIPKVFYKGEEIAYKRNVYFDWDTDKLDIGGLTYAIEHVEKENQDLTINRIERRVKGHASD